MKKYLMPYRNVYSSNFNSNICLYSNVKYKISCEDDDFYYINYSKLNYVFDKSKKNIDYEVGNIISIFND